MFRKKSTTCCLRTKQSEQRSIENIVISLDSYLEIWFLSGGAEEGVLVWEGRDVPSRSSASG